MDSVPFANNWAYLDTELSWLERLLLVAVSQQRQNLKSVTKVSKTPADQATSDWWQGLIAVKNRAYDDAAPKSSDQPSLGYQKKLDTRILLSRANKVALGLPTMQMALGLSVFEKKLVLMVLAPEVHVRYGKLYHYLQTGTHCVAGSLPTVDVALRVLCRNETERRRARMRLSGSESLLRRQVLYQVEGASTLLGSQLQLAPEWVEYLLAENPAPDWPMQFMVADQFAQRCRQRVLWSELGLADGLTQELQRLTGQLPLRLLLVGVQDEDNEYVAIAIATHVKQALHIIDLAQISSTDMGNCLTALEQANHPVILVKSAHHWLGKNSVIEQAALQHWLTHSLTPHTHIIFSVPYRHLVRCHWRQKLRIIDIPMPDANLRLKLWHQALPNGVRGMGKVRWLALADGLALSGSQIIHMGQLTQILAGDNEITLDHLQQALMQQGQHWKLR